ncbi:hypothetical protein ABDD95_21245 [Mucilaginibacter sp. PAMB04274]|uniref:hypothetical protein n=1 Tax=Mucilaginibacter sp. PAMB04274 TaxID=3138568 RepID=UPI0031F677CB
MANITEQDIINHLKEKINFHQQEAKRLEGILTAFLPEPVAGNGNQTNHISQPAAKATLAKAPAEPKPSKELEIPEKYADNLPITAKIAFALKEIGSGFNEDIANAMAQYEPKSDAKTISRQISNVLSNLKSKGQITVEKFGRKDKYSLPA